MVRPYKPVVLESYGARRKRRGPPLWLWLLASGIAIGAAGVLVVQKSYLPPRLSAEEAAQLRAAYEQSDAERQRLKGELEATAKRLDAAIAAQKNSADELAKSQRTAERLREELSAVLATLPPDPRGGPIEVRSGRFTVERGKLVYNVMLSRKRPEGGPFNGVVQLVVAGNSTRGGEPLFSFTSEPLRLSLDRYQSVRGSLTLPEGFKPSQTTIKVLDRPDGKQHGMRVMYVE